MNFPEFKRELVQHYVEMALTPGGWREQARHSVLELAKEYPSDFGDLPEMVNQEVFRRREAQRAAQ